jgi:hypothetical protein
MILKNIISNEYIYYGDITNRLYIVCVTNDICVISTKINNKTLHWTGVAPCDVGLDYICEL